MSGASSLPGRQVVAGLEEGNSVIGAVWRAVLPRLSPVTEHHGRTVDQQLAFLARINASSVGAFRPYPVLMAS
jgi:hypothetical protein